MAVPSVLTRPASVAQEAEAEAVVSEVDVEVVVATEAVEVVAMEVVDTEVVTEAVEVMVADNKVATLVVEAAMEEVVDTPVVGEATEEATSNKVVAVGNKCLSGPVFSLTRSYISRTEKSAWVAAKVNCVEGLELPSWMVDRGPLRGSGCGFTLASSCALLGVRGDSYLLCHTL